MFLDKPLFHYYLHDGETISKDKKRDVDGQEYIYLKYRSEILSQFGIKGLEQRYKKLVDRCINYKDIRYFKYVFLYEFSKKGILFLR